METDDILMWSTHDPKDTIMAQACAPRKAHEVRDAGRMNFVMHAEQHSWYDNKKNIQQLGIEGQVDFYKVIFALSHSPLLVNIWEQNI